jgi:hypothetical protein
MTPKEKAFLKFVKAECKRYGVKPKLVNKAAIKLGNGEAMEMCSGYFDGDGKVLACSMKHKDWLDILAHEYCHLKQWAEGCKEWKTAEKHLAYNKLSDWLEGKPVKNIKRYLAMCRDVELDNEKRTANLIKELCLPIDIPTYIKKANSYILFYSHMYYSRKWCTPQNSPYKIKEIVDIMSPRFNMGYKKMSNRVKRVYDRVYL